jgi:hypothetical protein
MVILLALSVVIPVVSLAAGHDAQQAAPTAIPVTIVIHTVVPTVPTDPTVTLVPTDPTATTVPTDPTATTVPSVVTVIVVPTDPPEPPETGGIWDAAALMGLLLVAGVLGASLVLAERSAR